MGGCGALGKGAEWGQALRQGGGGTFTRKNKSTPRLQGVSRRGENTMELRHSWCTRTTQVVGRKAASPSL